MGAEITKRSGTLASMFPQTVYAVALLWQRRDTGKPSVASHIVTVSGINPLTPDEAVARARKAREADWDRFSGGVGPLSDYEFVGGTVSWFTQELD